MSMSQEELITAGYPPRPDPVAGAPAFEKWRKIVSSSTTVIPANLVEIPGMHFDPVTYASGLVWSGTV
jgi:hypothetical protein